MAGRAFDWEAVKPLIIEQYCVQYHTADEVVAMLNAMPGHNHTPLTRRQLKTRLSAWNIGKKIPLEVYNAMNEVSKDFSTISFHYPRANGHSMAVVTPTHLRKEMSRKRKNAETKEQPPAESPGSLRAALTFLDSRHVRWSLPSFAEGDLRPMVAVLQLVPAGMVAERDQAYGDSNDDNDWEMLSDDSVEDGLVRQRDTWQLVNRNYTSCTPRYALREKQANDDVTPRRQYDRLPCPNAYSLNIAQSVLPESADTRMIMGDVDFITVDEAVAPNPSAESLDSTSASSALDIAELLADMTMDPHDKRLDFFEKWLGRKLISNWNRFDPDETKRLLCELVSYYIQQCQTGFKTLDDHQDSDRKEAKQKHSRLLERNSPHLLTAVYWVGTVLASSDKLVQMMGFYNDCWESVEHCDSDTARVARPIMRFLMKFNAGNGLAPQGDRYEDIQNDPRLADFDPDTEFCASTQYLLDHKQEETPNFVVLQVYHAWYLQAVNRCLDALILLVGHLPKVRRIMGRKHVVTAGCHMLIAKSYERIGWGYGEYHIEEAVRAYDDCAKPLNVLKYRAKAKLGEFKLKAGQYDEALRHITEVFYFRYDLFGVMSPETWGAARTRWDILCQQGFSHNARQEEAELTKAWSAKRDSKSAESPVT